MFMDKNRWKFFADILMFVDFLALATSGFILWLVLPRGSGAGGGTSFLLLREQWMRMHNFASVILIVLLLVHLILNWQWIKSMFRNVFNSKHF